MTTFQEKQDRKRQRYLDLADAADAKAAAEYEKSDLREEKSGIPLGQPILVGHHSERRHRRAIERADAAMRRSVELTKKAKYYREKAAGVGQGGISSDDPDAADKLACKIATLTEAQARMTASNRVIRKFARKGCKDATSPHFADYLDEFGERVPDALRDEQRRVAGELDKAS